VGLEARDVGGVPEGRASLRQKKRALRTLPPSFFKDINNLLEGRGVFAKIALFLIYKEKSHIARRALRVL
jgi:hypothetical protein